VVAKVSQLSPSMDHQVTFLSLSVLSFFFGYVGNDLPHERYK